MLVAPEGKVGGAGGVRGKYVGVWSAGGVGSRVSEEWSWSAEKTVIWEAAHTALYPRQRYAIEGHGPG